MASIASAGGRPISPVGIADEVGDSVGDSSSVGTLVVGSSPSVGAGDGISVGFGGGRNVRSTCS